MKEKEHLGRVTGHRLHGLGKNLTILGKFSQHKKNSHDTRKILTALEKFSQH